nr:hypothetical protein [Bacillus testis]
MELGVTLLDTADVYEKKSK